MKMMRHFSDDQKSVQGGISVRSEIYDYILKEYRIALTNDEIMYLIIHIRRIMTK